VLEFSKQRRLCTIVYQQLCINAFAAEGGTCSSQISQGVNNPVFFYAGIFIGFFYSIV
jgi:hypothetical protein